VEITTCVIGKQSKKKREAAKLSNSAKSRIQDLPADIEK
jgi:hypothetical protein